MRGRILILGGILAVLALTAAALFGSAEPDATLPPAETSTTEIALPENRDTELYRAVIARFAKGEGYYEAVSDLHRERSYPLFPFFTVRQPTLAWISVNVGTLGLYLIAWLVLLAIIAVWYRSLASQSFAVRAAFVGILALGGASTITPAGIVMHEFWCGLLITLSLGFMRQEHWPMRLLFAALALSLREFALAYLVVLGFNAILGRRWQEVLGVAAIVGLFAGGMALHQQAVDAVRIATDLKSPPWSGFRGPEGLVGDLSQVSWLGLLPWPLAAFLTFLPLAGWLLAPNRVTASLWFAGFGATIAIFARPNNTYWILVILPAYLAGLAFLARSRSLLTNTSEIGTR
ncbi:hypothetical protein [Altererythrobacter sp. MF3-039]|uniref:hypothetical protein n=1 Tax=Altererythrobacter sp. MF3-039 TaxID=3252901 RepID=UPI00390CD9B3